MLFGFMKIWIQPFSKKLVNLFELRSLLSPFAYVGFLQKYLDEDLNSCDLCLVVGTSSIVYPAAMFAPQVAERGVPVAEFNMETTPATHHFG